MKYILIKKLFDFAFTFFLMPIILPIILVVSVLIKFNSPREDIFFKQKRVGYKSKNFTVYKFRTMHSSTKNDIFTSSDDSRITSIGKILRKFRIDELPQFANILLGQMSLIGPRPEQDHFVEKLVSMYPDFNKRHNVLPGITGLAQIEHGYVGSLEEYKFKLEYDLLYVDNLSLIQDIKIFFKTFKVILTASGSR